MIHKVVWIGLVLAIGMAMLGGVAAFAAPGPVIDWFVVASGGGVISGGEVTIEGTGGQPIVGTAGGGAVNLSAGYWYVHNLIRLFLPLLLKP